MIRLTDDFALNWKGLNVGRGLGALAVLSVPFIVLVALDQEKYLLSVEFGVTFTALSDPGGQLGERLRPVFGTILAGAALTWFGYAIGDDPWGLVVLASFVVTVLCGLTMAFGIHTFIAAYLVNVWFLAALSLPLSYERSGVSSTAWSQALAWLIGGALWIVIMIIEWLAHHRRPVASHFPEIPSDTSPVKLTPPRVFFAVLRAAAVAIGVAIAFGFDVPDADWMPVATIVAMKASLDQSLLVAEQRLAGTIIGAAAAALFLVTIDNTYALYVVVVIFAAVATSIRGVNYALYCAAVACFLLVAMDIPHPSDLADESRRVLFTAIGVGIAVVLTLIVNELQKRHAPAAAGTAP